MNKMFNDFIIETNERLLAYEMDESAFSECYDDKDRELMKRLRKVLYSEKTECGERFCLDNDEGLAENKIKYCPFCGKKIKVVKEK